MELDADLVALGQAFRRARERKGMAQLKLAELAGCGERTITRIEYGRHSTHIRLLWEIANILEVPFSQLIAEAELDRD